MRKVILLLMAMTLLFSTQINAQTADASIPTSDKTYSKHEVDLGVGTVSDNQLLSFFADVIVTTITLTGVTFKDQSYTATWHAGYKYSLTKRCALGAFFVYDGKTSKIFVGNDNCGNLSNSYYTLALETDYKFVNKKNFKFYSLLGLGGTLFHQECERDATPTEAAKKDGYSLPYFNFQFTPVGLKFGNTFGAYAELGVGYKGLINAGLFYKF